VELSLGPQFIRDFKKLVKSDVFIGQVQTAVKTENPGFEKMDIDSFRRNLILKSRLTPGSFLSVSKPTIPGLPPWWHCKSNSN
jgi:hypothetical protein